MKTITPKCGECSRLVEGEGPRYHKFDCQMSRGWYPSGLMLPRRNPGLSLRRPERARVSKPRKRGQNRAQAR